jgi:hypothetical protein
LNNNHSIVFHLKLTPGPPGSSARTLLPKTLFSPLSNGHSKLNLAQVINKNCSLPSFEWGFKEKSGYNWIFKEVAEKRIFPSSFIHGNEGHVLKGFFQNDSTVPVVKTPVQVLLEPRKDIR